MKKQKRRLPSKKTKNGFSLIEILLYLAIFSFILISLTVLTGLIFQARARSRAISEVDYQGTRILNIISQKIRNSQSVSEPMRGNTSNILIFSLNGVNTQVYTKEVAGKKNIVVKEDAVENTLNSGDIFLADIINPLEFANYSKQPSPDSITISLTLKYDMFLGSGKYVYTKKFQNSASLR
ncbi:MAG: Uncharacterized protein CEN89_712 [Candidatus Berkelbacteria bacterium Licking1014_7]|uniref:Prepilin-type N-terminal cleavage/methylation domain-containing protein n=1 Tax=Candidatus Berkelbacteria bacterium Licking1014_7 TaxID=2017147 RepID=A0A554LHV4_9BACT|nr:MAG: Uncharacterized protein CEN89_712 [Candidatus Berkelbacteria bacterium Licking1014_7]